MAEVVIGGPHHAALLADPADAVQQRSRLGIGFWLVSGWLLIVVLAAAFADVLPLTDPSAIDLRSISTGPTLRHPLGTDSLGRDLFTRLVFGSRVTVMVSLGAVGVALAIGVTLGVVSGYLRGWTDRTLSWMVNVLLAFPPLVLAVALASVIGPSLTNVVLAIGIIVVPTFARIARASTIQVCEREFVTVARSLGAGDTRIVVTEVLPNIVQPVLTLAITLLGLVAIVEGGLSFLGLGVPLPKPTWGGMIQEGQAKMFTNPVEVLAPSSVLFLTVLSLNLVSERLGTRFGLSGART